MTDFEKKTHKVRYLEIFDDSKGQRIDNFLIKQLKGVPKSLIYKKIRKGEVRINGNRSKPTSKLDVGDIVRLPPIYLKTNTKIDVSENLKELVKSSIIYEDEKLLVLDKPSGVAVHGGSGIDHGIIESTRKARPELTYLELAHRLDKDTSGCLILAKKRSALRELNELQKNKMIQKRYFVLMCGSTNKEKIRVNKPLKKNILKSGERIVTVDDEGKESITEFYIISRYKNHLFAEALLKTGRTHQIRVHAKSIGLHVAGDRKYGSSECNEFLKNMGLNRLFLHAHKLSFSWLDDNKVLSFEANLPIKLKNLLDKLK